MQCGITVIFIYMEVSVTDLVMHVYVITDKLKDLELGQSIIGNSVIEEIARSYLK
jgi:hypothetical protein